MNRKSREEIASMSSDERATYYRERYQALSALPITDEEKERWKPMMLRTWDAIAHDVYELGEKVTKAIAVEMVLDANRVQMYGHMTDEEYAVVSAHYSDKKFERWARSLFNP